MPEQKRITTDDILAMDNDTALSSNSDSKIASQKAVKSYVDTIVGSVVKLQGDWDASTNTPNISSTTTTGFAWKVSVAGTTNLGGITSWFVGDMAVKTATGWLKIDNQDLKAVWGQITGTLSNQTDLNTALGTKQANLSGTGIVKSTAGTISYLTDNSTNWDTAYTDRNKWDGGSTGLVAATGRTSLGATTVGSNLFTLTNPSAITFPRFNADNTVSALDAASFRTAIGAGTSTVTPSALTKTDDTNVTLTLGGTPATSLLQAVSLTLGWTGTLADGRIASATNWNTAYTNRITSLTTTGSSGSATLSSNTLNIPTYTLAGLGGQPQLNGTGFVKTSGTTISYDNTTYQPLLTNPITGTSTAGNVSYWDTTSTQNGNSNFTWDNTNNTLALKNTAAQDNAVLGAELLSASGWTSTGWTGTYNSFTHTTGNTNALSNSITATIGNIYLIKLTVSGGNNTDTLSLSFGGNSFSAIAFPASSYATDFVIKASSTGNLIITPTSTFTGTISVSLKQITKRNFLNSISNSGATTLGGINFSLSGIFFTSSSSTTFSGGSLNTGTFNNFFGYNAGQCLVSGQRNNVFGSNSLGAISLGSNNSVFGDGGLFNFRSGSNNVVIGSGSSMGALIFGSSNSSIGYSTGVNIFEANRTQIFGSSIGCSGTGYGINDNLYLGYGFTFPNETNTIRIQNGNSAYTSMYIQDFGKIDTSDNVAWGKSALLNNIYATKNVAIGTGALQTLSFTNTGTAYELANISIGYGSGNKLQPTASSTDSFGNLLIGIYSGYNLVSGSQNVSIGGYALQGAPAANKGMVNGSNNINIYASTPMSSSSSTAESSGYNTCIGDSTGRLITTALRNTLVGYQAGNNLTSGNDNVFLGRGAGTNLSSAGNNICIGNLIGSSVDHTGSCNLYIGQGSVTSASESNTIRIQNIVSAYTSAYIQGISGQTSAAGVAVLINSSHKLGTTTSSIRYKENIVDMADYSSDILKLRPVMFDYKEEGADKHQPGLIAEEVEKIMPELVAYAPKKEKITDEEGNEKEIDMLDENGNPVMQVETVRYLNLIPLLLNEVKKLEARVKELESK